MGVGLEGLARRQALALRDELQGNGLDDPQMMQAALEDPNGDILQLIFGEEEPERAVAEAYQDLVDLVPAGSRWAERKKVGARDPRLVDHLAVVDLRAAAGKAAADARADRGPAPEV